MDVLAFFKIHDYMCIHFCFFVWPVRFLQLFDKYDVKKKLKIKLKSPGELQVLY